MKLKNIIISFFLLFVYSISFAHSLSFHEHGFYAEHQHEFISDQETEHHHNHHSHNQHSETKTAHINHNNHCDEGIFDLIICVLSEANHHHNDCHLEHQPTHEYKRVSNQSNVKLILSFNSFVIQSIDSFSKTELSSPQLSLDIQSKLIDTSPLRGPPVLS